MTTPPTPGNGRSTAMEAAEEAAGPILTLATAFSLVRVFEGGTWVLPVFIAAAVSHLLAVSVRRIGWGMLVSALVSGAGMVLTVTWTHYWDSAVWGLPLGDTRRRLTDDLEQAWTAFGDLSPPVTPVVGFTVSAMAAIWLIAFLNDWSAMRARALLESMLLPVVAVGFVGLVSDERHRILAIGSFTAALLLFASVHRVAARTADAVWLGGDGRASAGRRALMGGSAAVAVVALAGAVATGSVLGGSTDPLFDLTEVAERGQRSSGRVVISPLVDIRGRLVNQAEDVMFRVRADNRSYWRLTSLDQFDGQVWTSRAEYTEKPARLPSLVQSGTSVEESVQEYSIEQLAAVWLPAAFEPRFLESDTIDISYEPSSSTLIVGRSLANSNGVSYTVASALPRFDPEVLETLPAASGANSELASYTSLPRDFSSRAGTLASELTAGLASDYEKTLALQNFFRDGSFTYDANVAPGHSESRIEEFLEAQRGYCEQFAGTFAAMARSLGMPARVAVGFTVGEADPIDPSLYLVRGKHAHAWPEVFLAGAGWVAFEPTPSRGAPGAQNYTGVAENQDESGPPASSAEDAAAIVPDGAPDAPIDFESLAPPQALDPDDGSTASGDGGGGGLTWRSWVAVLAAVSVALLVLLIPGLKRVRRQRRFHRAAGNRGKIRLLWAETVEQLALIDVTPRHDETHAEFSHRAIGQIPLHSPDLRQLGDLAAASTFAPSEPTDRHQWLARTWSMSVRSEVNFRISRRQKLAAFLSPRPLFRYSRYPRSGRSASPRRKRLRMRRPGDRR